MPRTGLNYSQSVLRTDDGNSLVPALPLAEHALPCLKARQGNPEMTIECVSTRQAKPVLQKDVEATSRQQQERRPGRPVEQQFRFYDTGALRIVFLTVRKVVDSDRAVI